MIRPFDEDEELDENESTHIEIKNECTVEHEDDTFTPDEEMCSECNDEQNEIVKWKMIGFSIFVIIIFVFTSF